MTHINNDNVVYSDIAVTHIRTQDSRIRALESQLNQSNEKIKILRDALNTLRMSPNICGCMSGQPFSDESKILLFIDKALNYDTTTQTTHK